MFSKRFAYQYATAGENPWAHLRGWYYGHGWWGRRLLGRQIRRNFFGRGGPFGPGGPFSEEGFPGFPGGGKRFFGRGDLKYALLELLQEHPMHGYEMMKALQERTGGLYTPSAGSVYPTLQMLEDRDFVTVSEVDGKKVYTITDAGRAFLAEQQPDEDARRPFDAERPPAEHDWPGRLRRGFWQAQDVDWAALSEMRQELLQFGMLFGNACRSAMQDPAKLQRLKALLAQMRAELRDIAGIADE